MTAVMRVAQPHVRGIDNLGSPAGNSSHIAEESTSGGSLSTETKRIAFFL